MEYRQRLLSALTLIIFMLALGTFVFSSLEHWSWLNALYFSTATLTTVGYGDIVTHTIWGRLFNIFYMLVGVATALYALTIVAEHYFEMHLQRVKNGGVVTKLHQLNEGRRARLKKSELYKGLVNPKRRDKD